MIELNKVIPTPLLENGLNPASDVFNTEGIFFEKGKNYLITAPSGKGKSTLIHAVYGLRDDYEGSIFFEKKDIRTQSVEDWAVIRQQKLAIVFQDLRLFLNLTARENIELKRQLTGNDSLKNTQNPQLKTQNPKLKTQNELLKTQNPKLKTQNTPSVSDLENWSKRLGIADFLDKTAATLSYGQRQRVAIVRALAQPFDYLLLDEPFSHLDTENIKIATEIIKEACEQQKAGLLLVSLGDAYFFDYDKCVEI